MQAPKVQLKIQIEPEIHGKLRRLCEIHRRTPAGQIEHMTLFFFQQDFEGAGPGLRPGKGGLQADARKDRRPSKEA